MPDVSAPGPNTRTMFERAMAYVCIHTCVRFNFTFYRTPRPRSLHVELPPHTTGVQIVLTDRLWKLGKGELRLARQWQKQAGTLASLVPDPWGPFVRRGTASAARTILKIGITASISSSSSFLHAQASGNNRKDEGEREDTRPA
ncbi:hypothetical protein BaRGS_00017528, partial [Batillaria attramentaria]